MCNVNFMKQIADRPGKVAVSKQMAHALRMKDAFVPHSTRAGGRFLNAGARVGRTECRRRTVGECEYSDVVGCAAGGEVLRSAKW